ncbi:MAG: hypothetical protein JWN15_955 [Firmicutes bacterium]|nr:hypothetical protein [Bacillota bacterium]
MKTWQHSVGAIGLAVAISSTSAFAFAAPPTGANPVQNYPGPQTVTVNGKVVTSDLAPRMVDGALMVPLRAVVEAAGGDIQWDQQTQAVVVHMGQSFSTFMVGRDSAELRKVGVMYIKPNMVQMQHAAVLTANRTLIPADALTTILGFSIKPGQYTTLDLTWPAPAAQ